ncbi:MAG: aminotransferase class I/II-fold pyridoxal phosphate-dependent enzyme [Deltaproteobacteria bacterium]|nr:aminotransferase class I/II-fold pyridoxal phosphate-dependent enzyme [Deltaproteobacteria bacterium]
MAHPRHPSHPETTSISEGFDPALSVMSVRPPIYPVSTYAFTSAEAAAHHFDVALGRARAAPGESIGLIYARLNNPNAEMFEDALCSVEKGAEAAAVFSSGMAAIATTLMTFARPGRKILYQRPVYGGTDHLLHHVLPAWGVEPIAVPDGGWPEAVLRHGADVAVVYLETPANPTLHMIDLAAVVAAVRASPEAREAPIVVDNTFLGPVFQSPLVHGVDLAVYSATKFLGGHSDLVAGAVTGRTRALVDRVKTLRAFIGNICEPFTAWLLQRSMATLHLRMIKQSKSASKLVQAIEGHPAVARVHYPTRLTGEQARVFAAQCSAPGSMISLELHGGRAAAFRFLDALRIVRLAVSLGGVESLACHPRSTTASEMSEDDLRVSGVTEGLVRLSIGVEYWRDLLADLRGALDAAAA